MYYAKWPARGRRRRRRRRGRGRKIPAVTAYIDIWMLSGQWAAYDICTFCVRSGSGVDKTRLYPPSPHLTRRFYGMEFRRGFPIDAGTEGLVAKGALRCLVDRRVPRWLQRRRKARSGFVFLSWPPLIQLATLMVGISLSISFFCPWNAAVTSPRHRGI
ncbi:hypothetical protein GGS23DRAFT_226375 [Durotheca rogersii]|uniref:uncharacterized protein n=1 Tax=Durotheca rogersii TaxID=419775 RepID=UPI00221EF00D|nr:uncharacterized protein GGS23DRAFT_226375 [Durotheca rogersii]KAI5860499.1 hypothetical protein GGS23DRAFT_226375 [Durotheca rogersii]